MDIINARLPGYQGLRRIQINSRGLIQAIPPQTATPSEAVIDVEGDWLSLGGLDLQINGALGLAFPDLRAGDEARLAEICRFLWNQGVDGFLPTLVTTSLENIQRSLAFLANFQAPAEGAQILGVHLEGPFLNVEKRGAHPAEYLRSLTLDQVKQVLGDYAALVKVMTLAPELDTTGEVVTYLRSLGITVSLGHSQATAAQAQQAFDQGASMVTHAFNAMPSLHHREPGLLGVALTREDVYCGLIADGQHVSPIMLDLLLRSSQGAFLVSDALSPLGLPDGFYPWDQRQIQVMDGTARLPDGTLSGTTLPLLTGAQNLVSWGICDIERAIALSTTLPRRAIGLPNWIGEPSRNLVRWHWDEAQGQLAWQRLMPAH